MTILTLNFIGVYSLRNSAIDCAIAGAFDGLSIAGDCLVSGAIQAAVLSGHQTARDLLAIGGRKPVFRHDQVILWAMMADALQNEPAFKDGGHEGKLGYLFLRLFKMDWPVKDEDVRATWDIDKTQDTDGDVTPDVEDDDIDGDGSKNRKDRSPYDSTKQFKRDETVDTDRKGVPDIIDSYPKNPGKSFVSKRLQDREKIIVRSLW